MCVPTRVPGQEPRAVVAAGVLGGCSTSPNTEAGKVGERTRNFPDPI